MKKLIAAISAASMLLTMPTLAADTSAVTMQGGLSEPGCYSVEVEAPDDADTIASDAAVEVDDTTAHEVHGDCGSVIVGYAPAEDDADDVSLLNAGVARGTSKPKKFWNIALKGIYHGNFWAVAGTIYTECYFDWDENTHCYYTRVRVANDGYTDTRTFRIKNYCTKCGEVSSTKEYTVPAGGGYTDYIYIKHYFTSKHDGEGHWMYPAVECTNSYGKIKGTIDVNYVNSWD